jgi:hypothetical protein
MAARLHVLMKGWNLAENYLTVTFGAPLLFVGEDWQRHPHAQAIHAESYCYINDCDLFPRLLGAKSESWRPFFAKNNDLVKKYGACAAAMTAAAAVAATCATGGIATAVMLGAGVAMGAKARYEAKEHGVPVRQAATVKLIVKGLSSAQLDSPQVQAYRPAGRFYHLGPDGCAGPLDEAAVRAALQVPTASLLEAVAAHRIQAYQARLRQPADPAGPAVPDAPADPADDDDDY